MTTREGVNVKVQSVEGKQAESGAILSYPKEQRIAQIEQVIAVHQVTHKTGLSMRQIAKQINMAPSDHLMKLLWHMSDAGYLRAKRKPYRDNMISYLWYVSRDRLGVVLDRVYGK